MSTINEKITQFCDPSNIIWYVKGTKRTCVCSNHLPPEYKAALDKEVSEQISCIQENVDEELEDEPDIDECWLSDFCGEYDLPYPDWISAVSKKGCYFLDHTEEHYPEEKYVNVSHLDYYFENEPVPLVREQCDVCRLQTGIAKIRNIFEISYKRRVIAALEENWLAPRADGSCPYAEWSWKKMQQELVD